MPILLQKWQCYSNDENSKQNSKHLIPTRKITNWPQPFFNQQMILEGQNVTPFYMTRTLVLKTHITKIHKTLTESVTKQKITKHLSCMSYDGKQTSNLDRDDGFYKINQTRANWHEMSQKLLNNNQDILWLKDNDTLISFVTDLKSCFICLLYTSDAADE